MWYLNTQVLGKKDLVCTMIDQGMGKKIKELNLNYFLNCLKFFMQATLDQSMATGIKDLNFKELLLIS